MTGFFGRLFGGGTTTSADKPGQMDNKVMELVESHLAEVIRLGSFKLSHEIFEEEGELIVDLFGEDEELLLEREGQMLDSLQLFLKRVLQHRMPDERVNLVVDCDGFREEADKALMDLADRLKGVALEKGKSVYIRALPPKDRKVVHQYLAGDGRVKSRSVGDGHFKKIKIYPAKVQVEGPNTPHPTAG